MDFSGGKVKVLTEALPYIKKFQDKIFVIKYGGSIMSNEEAKDAFIKDVALLKLVGINIVLVHGGGPDISGMLKKLNIQTKFVKGLRVTDQQTVEVVEMVLSGKVNKELASRLSSHGIKAVGISGRDSNIVTAKKKYLEDGDELIDIGFVGEVTSINKELLIDLIKADYLPVISPVGCDETGQIYNVNADYVAGAISSVLQAEKLILLTDVKGLFKDIQDESSFISEITVPGIVEYIRSGVIKGGMIPKMECCMQSIEEGTKNIHLVNGNVEHSLLLEIFTKAGIGTMVKGEE
ncbi:MAG: acetylglutamate kinase [Peptoclostridium sp.]|uniref:acetylglutamate kinase n=1 Tax=Peptoclostridium sp. TaxID=1904860 RepID=UPI00139B1C19|nr:acetylglutamate kinase [Peptoclostridium sp.]MZQ75560.1 acetylglutamate kinase [Peptoclostridium sp.]